MFHKLASALPKKNIGLPTGFLSPGVRLSSRSTSRVFSLNFHNKDVSEHHFAGGPTWPASPPPPRCLPHLSRFQKRGKGKSGRVGWRIRTPTWWGGGERGEEAAREGRGRAGAAATPRGAASERPRALAAAGGSRAGEPREPRRGRAKEQARGPAARRDPAASPPGPASAPPRAPQQSVRLLLQLPRVEGLRGGKARRREGRGGMKAAWSLPGGGEGARVMRGCSEPAPSHSATRLHRGTAARWAKGQGKLESPES